MLSHTQTSFESFVLEPSAARGLRYSVRERRAVHAYSVLTLFAVYGSLVLMERALWTGPAVFLLIAACAIRYSGYMHALNHAYRLPEAVPWLLDAMPAAWSPFIPNFKEIQRIHLTHHKLEGGLGDPDNFMIASPGRVMTFLRCACVFEYWFFYAIKHRWQTARFWPGWLVRLAIFGTIAWSCSAITLLTFMVGTKVGTGISFYIVSYLAHVRDGRQGNFLPFSRDQPPLVLTVAVGSYASQAAFLHPLHHVLPWVSCGGLVRALASRARPVDSREVRT
jgi:fatty acid desaturase